MMVLKYTNLLVPFYEKKSMIFIIKVLLDYIGMTVYQFLDAKVVLNKRK